MRREAPPVATVAVVCRDRLARVTGRARAIAAVPIAAGPGPPPASRTAAAPAAECSKADDGFDPDAAAPDAMA